ncbi:TauD/TfdA family dioxygenase [Streptomyces sp. NPDC004296]|uniref:TauD/TfdA family dioxygenase n=1 Tax=Streptomyces sp. NPDC004296 TaxID=3364697 RepID=UPI0036908659
MTGVRSVLTRPLAGPAVWRGADLVANRAWALRLEPSHLQELDAAVRAVRARGTPLLKVTADDFPLPTLAGELRRIADVLENGRGFALVEQLPVERYGAAAAATLLWGIGRHLGVPVSQNATGHMLGHVRDTGHPKTDPGVRGYQTRAALPFHTDESDVLALLCLRPARSGGRVSLASSAAVYNGLLAQRPRLAARLYRTHCLDRREEQAPGESPYLRVPLATWCRGKLSIRYNRHYLESAQRFPDVPRLEPADAELFDLIDALAASPGLRLGLDFAPGDLLLLNNHAVLHSRTQYEDSPEPERQRHVLRIWLTPNQPRMLPSYFWGEPHGARCGPGRGGILPRDVITPPEGQPA